jgi:hypothetical protein
MRKRGLGIYVDRMTPEQINVAIAEACGWADFSQGVSGAVGVKPGETCWDHGRNPIPSYFSDLNACMEMEEMLNTDALTDHYESELFKIVWYNASFRNSFKAIHASAPQRCEAFLRVKGILIE